MVLDLDDLEVRDGDGRELGESLPRTLEVESPQREDVAEPDLWHDEDEVFAGGHGYQDLALEVVGVQRPLRSPFEPDVVEQAALSADPVERDHVVDPARHARSRGRAGEPQAEVPDGRRAADL